MQKILIVLCLEKILNTTRKRNKAVVLFSQRKNVKHKFKNIPCLKHEILHNPFLT